MDKMAEMPIRNLLLNMGAPMMISMLGQALYNVVDTFFVSHIPNTAQIADMGDKAINALTLAFPIQMLIMALGVGTGVGINAMIAKNLGRGNREQASRTAGNAIFVTLCYFVLIFLFGLTSVKDFIHSQSTDMVIATVYFKKGVGIESNIRYLKPERQTLGSIYSIGLPAIVMQILTPIMSYTLNLILGAISVSAVTAYGVYYKLQNFIFMPGYGLNNASIPIISYNFGARNKQRVSQTVRYGLIYVSVIMLIGIALLQLFARQIVGIFSVTEESHQLCVLALRIITCGFFFAGANIILQGVCQALGKGIYSLVISLLRFIVLVLPMAWALSLTENAASLVWLSLPVAEAGACVAAILLTRKIYRKAL